MLNYFGVADNGYRMAPLYNVAPTQQITAIISDGERRRIGSMRWGIIQPSSKTAAGRWNTFNARAETLLIRPTYRNLISRKRCIIPVDGFFEWRRSDKTPLRIQLKRRPVFP